MRIPKTITREELGRLRNGRDIRWVCVKTPGCLNEYYTGQKEFLTAAGESLPPEDEYGLSDCRVFMINECDDRVYGIGSAALVADSLVSVGLVWYIETTVCFPCSGTPAPARPEEAESVLNRIIPYSGRHVYRPLDVKAAAAELFLTENYFRALSADGYVYESGYVKTVSRDRFTLLRKEDEYTEIVCFPSRNAKRRVPGSYTSVKGKEKYLFNSGGWRLGMEEIGDETLRRNRFTDKEILERLKRGHRTQWLYMKCPSFREVCHLDIKEILRIADTLSEETREYLEGAVTPRQPRTALRDILPRIKVFMTCKGRLFGIGKLSGGQDGRLTASLEYSLEYGEEPDLRWLPLLQSGCDGVFGISRRDAMDILDCINPYTERIVSRMPGRAAMDPDTRLSVYHRHPVAEQYVRFQGRISHADCNCLRFEIHLWRNTYAVITCVLPDTAADELYSEGERVTVEGRLTECRLTTDPGNIYCFDGCIFADTINK